MSAAGQTEKNSVRANVFRFTLKLGHRLMQSARPNCHRGLMPTQQITARIDRPRLGAAARGGGGLCHHQGDLTRQPLVAPIKTHLTPELAFNHIFHSARAEPAVRGRCNGRPT